LLLGWSNVKEHNSTLRILNKYFFSVFKIHCLHFSLLVHHDMMSFKKTINWCVDFSVHCEKSTVFFFLGVFYWLFKKNKLVVWYYVNSFWDFFNKIIIVLKKINIGLILNFIKLNLNYCSKKWNEPNLMVNKNYSLFLTLFIKHPYTNFNFQNIIFIVSPFSLKLYLFGPHLFCSRYKLCVWDKKREIVVIIEEKENW
jgi:hypothetical protein